MHATFTAPQMSSPWAAFSSALTYEVALHLRNSFKYDRDINIASLALSK